MAGRTLSEDASLATQPDDSVQSLIDYRIRKASTYYPGQPCSTPAEP